MNRVKFNITRQQTSESKNYLYELYIGSEKIYDGKIFFMQYQDAAVVDITDILNDWQYAGEGILKPSLIGSEYKQQTQNEKVLDGKERHYENVMIKWYDNGIQIGSTNRFVYFHTIPFNVESLEYKINNKTSYYFGSLVPRMPKVSTKNLRYGQLIYSGSQVSPVWTGDNNHLYTFASRIGSRVCSLDLQRMELDNINSLSALDNGIRRDILRLDSCPAPYYLCWNTANGGFQCQPFTGASQYTEESSRNTKVSVDDMTDIANSQINGKWQLKSYNLTDAEYNEYIDITRSQYLLLYDTKLDRCTYVNVDGNSIVEKKYSNNSRRLVYFEISLKSREQLLNNI